MKVKFWHYTSAPYCPCAVDLKVTESFPAYLLRIVREIHGIDLLAGQEHGRGGYPALALAKAVTVCEMILDAEEGKDPPVRVVDSAVCGPKDQFSRKLGRMISFGRARKRLREVHPALPDKAAEIFTADGKRRAEFPVGYDPWKK